MGTGRDATARARKARRLPRRLVVAVVCAAGILVTNFPAMTLFHQRRALAAERSQLASLSAQNRSLTQEQQRLSDPSEVEQLARQDFQLVQPGEQVYSVLPPSASGATSSGGSSATGVSQGDPGLQAPVPPADAPGAGGGGTSGTSPAGAGSTGGG